MARTARRRRQTGGQQKLAIYLGAGLLLLVVIVGVATAIQGGRQAVTDSSMQRILSTNVSRFYFAVDNAYKVDDVVYIKGSYVGGERRLEDEENLEIFWEDMTQRVANAFSASLRNIAKEVEVEYYHRGVLVGHAKAMVR